MNPLIIVVVVAAVAYVLWSRMKGQPLKLKRLVVLPLVFTVIGITDLTGSSAHHLNTKDIAFLVASLGVSAVLGAARGATIELYPQQGELWQRYRRSTVALWITLIATKLALTVIATGAGAAAGGGTNTLLASLGVSLLAEAAIVCPRALSTGLPFAADNQTPDGSRSGQSPSRPSLTNRFLDMTPTRQISDDSWVNQGVPFEPVTPRPVTPRPATPRPATPRPATPPTATPRTDTGPDQWSSPSLRDGVSWLRQQMDQSPGKRQ